MDQPITKPAKKAANAKTSLAERLQRLEQQKARLQLAESKIKDDERKARTRRLIEIGALVEKAGLAALPANALYGALIETAKKADRRQRSRAVGDDWRPRLRARSQSPRRRQGAARSLASLLAARACRDGAARRRHALEQGHAPLGRPRPL